MKWNNSAPCLGLVFALLVAFGANADDTGQETSSPVVMVCTHGAVKSLMAVKLFDQEAEQRGLPYHAVSRGLDLYPAVPAKIADALTQDGFDVSGFKPQELSSQDVGGALRVVSIGADLSAFQEDAASTILQWDDIPPASVEYEASKAALLKHIQTLFDELEQPSR